MLQGTAAADTEMRAPRHHSIRRCRQHLDQPRLIPLTAALEYTIADALARQRAFDEHRLAGGAGNTAAIMGEIHDIRLLNLLRPQFAGHAARNSLKCAAGESSSNCRTRAHSRACSAAFSRPRSNSNRR